MNPDHTLTPFERGYRDALRGHTKEDNPFDKESAPYSFAKWLEGLKKAQKEHTK